MPTSSSTVQVLENHPHNTVPARYRWDLAARSAAAGTSGRASYRRLEGDRSVHGVSGHARPQGARQLLAAFRAMDEMGALSYRVWYFASLQYDEDQRDNEINARRQQVQMLFARQQQASSWFNPELLAMPLETVRGWMDGDAGAGGLPLRHREPVPRAGARARRARASGCCRIAGRFNSVPVRQLRGADDGGHEVPDDHAGERRARHADLRAVPGAARDQPQPGRSRRGLSRVPPDVRRQPEHLCGALQRRAAARLVPRPCARLRHDARGRAARQQHPDVGRREPDRGDEGGRRAAAALPPAAAARAGARDATLFDVFVPLVRARAATRTTRSGDWIVDSVAPLGGDYQAAVRDGVRGPLDRRVRERGQAQRRLLGAGVRRRIRTCC